MSTFLKSKKVLVTGGAGFIGANLVKRLLDEEADVHLILKEVTDTWRIKQLLSHPNISLHFEDILDKSSTESLIQRIEPAVIYHLATHGAYSSQCDGSKILQTNILSTFHLLEAAKKINLQLFVNTGSSSEYGEKKLPMLENELTEPDSFYAISKVAATNLCHLYASKWNVPVVTLRLFSVYGPLEEQTRLVPTLLHSLAKKLPMSMVDASVVRDFVYIDDVIDLYLKVDQLSRFPGEVFNVGTGIETSLKKLTKIAESVTQMETSFEWGKMPERSWDKSHWSADMSKTEDLLKWKAKYSVELGLLRSWNWYLQYQQINRAMLH